MIHFFPIESDSRRRGLARGIGFLIISTKSECVCAVAPRRASKRTKYISFVASKTLDECNASKEFLITSAP
jgi:hypothetical protein